MKRFICLILVLTISFSLVACNSTLTKKEDKKDTTTAETTKHDPTIKNNRKEVLALLEEIYEGEYVKGECIFCNNEAAKNMIVCSECGLSGNCAECGNVLKNSEYLLCKSCYSDYTADTTTNTGGDEPDPTIDSRSEAYYNNKLIVEDTLTEFLYSEYGITYTTDMGCSSCTGDLDGENMICRNCLANNDCIDCGTPLSEDDFALCFDCFFVYYKVAYPEDARSLETLWENEGKIYEIAETVAETNENFDPNFCIWCLDAEIAEYSYFCDDCQYTAFCLECEAELEYEEFMLCESCLSMYYEAFVG